MTLSAGTLLGPYEVLSPLGAGGMGEVYRARDGKLNRDVAIKVLPDSVARNPDRLARFEREAKVVAALSHPNILAIHDFGNQDGTAYAVMELLEEARRRREVVLPSPALAALGVRDSAVQRCPTSPAKKMGPRHARAHVTREFDEIRESLESGLYCLWYTIVLFTASPLAFVPIWVIVIVLPSAETTTFAVTVVFPPFFQVLL